MTLALCQRKFLTIRRSRPSSRILTFIPSVRVSLFLSLFPFYFLPCRHCCPQLVPICCRPQLVSIVDCQLSRFSIAAFLCLVRHGKVCFGNFANRSGGLSLLYTRCWKYKHRLLARRRDGSLPERQAASPRIGNSMRYEGYQRTRC